MHATIHTARLLALIEQLVDVNQYAVDGTHVWGLFRTAMHFPLQQLFAPANVPDEVAATLRAAFAARCTPQAMAAAMVPHAREGSADGPIVMVAGGPTHHRVVDGERVSPIADGWTARLEAAGHRVLKVDVLPEWLAQHQPRRYPSMALAQPTDAERQRGGPVARGRWMPVVEALFAEVSRQLAPVVGFTLDLDDSMPQAIARFVVERETAGRWLDRVRPRAVCFICYYETCYLPLLSACHARGIPTVDLQHGMNGSIHPAYSHWTALPPHGYDVFPSDFLTWGAISSAHLTRWWPAGQGGHRVVVGGRPDLDPSAAPRWQPHAGELQVALARAARRVLITMQDKPISAAQLAEMRRCPADWLWLVRAHPNAARFPAGSAESVQGQLAAAGIGNAMIVPPAVATLEELLSVVDVHCTHHSSSWMEAAMLGVPTVFTLPGADQLFEYELADGLAWYAPDGAGMRAVIEAGRGLLRVEPGVVIETSRAVAEVAMTRLFGRAG
jgi:hypothetical protein